METIIDDPLQGAMLATNIENNSAISRQQTSTSEDQPSITRGEVEVMLKKEQEKASASTISLDLKPPYLVEVGAKPYPTGYVMLQLQDLIKL